MAIRVGQAFRRTGAFPLDESTAMKFSEMRSVNDDTMPARYFTICQEDGQIYLYDKSALPSAETGKFRLFKPRENEGLYLIPVDEAGLSQSAVQGDGVMEGVLTSPYTFEEIYAQHEAGKLCAVLLSNTADGTKDVFLPLAFSGDAETVGSQGWCEHTYFDYPGGSVTQPTPMMMTVSVAKQSSSTKVYVTKTAFAGGGSAYDDTELRAMIGNVADLQTASHEVVGAINELQTGNVFPVVNPSTVTGAPLVFLRADSNADDFWLYNINGYPGNPVDVSSYVPAGANSFYLRSDLIYSKKGEPVNTRGYTSTIECFLTDDGFASNPGQRSGIAYIQLYGGGTMTARILYIPSTGRLHLEGAVQLAKEEDLARRPVAYTLDVDEHFISPNISYGYSKTKEFLPGAQVDLEFWDTANFPADFDLNDPTTYPAPMAVYTGSVIGDDLKFTINGVVGQYNAARNVVELDLTSFPEYDSAEENGTLYIHGTMVKKLDSILLPSGGGGGGGGGGNADFTLDTTNNFATIQNQGQGLSFQFNDDDVTITASDPGTYQNTKKLATQDYVDSHSGGAFVLDTANPCSYNELQNAINASKVILIKHEGAMYPFVEKWESDENTKRYVNVGSLQRQGVDKGAMYFFFEATIGDFDSPMAYSSNFTQPIGKPYTDSIAGNLTDLTTTAKTDIVSAINELKGSVDALGEPFRLKNWASNTLNVKIPPVTSDVANTAIPSLDFEISDVEGADYQVAGLLAYEIFDAASGGNRINCFPVCQFTGNGQKTLRVRMMCAGTSEKTAKRINGWVLLKHRREQAGLQQT